MAICLDEQVVCWTGGLAGLGSAGGEKEQEVGSYALCYHGTPELETPENI